MCILAAVCKYKFSNCCLSAVRRCSVCSRRWIAAGECSGDDGCSTHSSQPTQVVSRSPTGLDLACGDMQWMSCSSTLERTSTSPDSRSSTASSAATDADSRRRDGGGGSSDETSSATSCRRLKDFDLILARHVLVHLGMGDVLQVLAKLSRQEDEVEGSKSKFLLATSFAEHAVNAELNRSSVGRYRPLNLQAPPISLHAPRCLTRDGPPGERSGLFLGLWRLPLTTVAGCTSSHAANTSLGLLHYCTSL